MGLKFSQCEDEPLNRVPSKSNCNSTEISFPSVIPNSQESTYISQDNVVKGKRQRKQRKKD